MDDGVDGWWPDQGDGFDGPSELNRHRMYWEGTQRYRPNERPFALHRNASAGVQRYGGMIWSGDVQSRWETLKTHVPVAINTGLSGLPYWGTDIGGLVPVRGVLSGISRARPQLAFAIAMGLGWRRRRSTGDEQLSP
jgi:alpha-glucosidase/alpha-D-xyloside xylohydrolase